jgi:hypothetical protein
METIECDSESNQEFILAVITAIRGGVDKARSMGVECAYPDVVAIGGWVFPCAESPAGTAD